MSTENVEVVRRWTDAYNSRDISALPELITPDFEFHSIFAAIDSGGVFRAPDGFPGHYYEALDEAYEYFRVIPEEFIDAGSERSCWSGTRSGAAAAAAPRGRPPIWVGLRIRDGRVCREETFTDRAAALAAAGMDDG